MTTKDKRQGTCDKGQLNYEYAVSRREYDCYAPATSSAYSIIDTIANKVGKGQTRRIVLNLEDSRVLLDEMQQQLAENPIPELQEIIVIKDNRIIPFYP